MKHNSENYTFLRLDPDRKIGVEIEFGSLSTEKTQNVIIDFLGGEPLSDVADKPGITNSRIGTIEVYLDARWRPSNDQFLGRAINKVASIVVPVEIVTEPLSQEDLPLIETLGQRLAEAGAKGTQDSLLNGFGMHLNVEAASLEADHVVPVLTAFALCEEALRSGDNVDISRKIQPFIKPYPAELTDRLCSATPSDMKELCNCYLMLAANRNHALDLLPLLAHLYPEQVAAALPDNDKTAARPAYHYRLPDCRLGSPNWTVAREWNRWVTIEQIADHGVLEELKTRWCSERTKSLNFSDWGQISKDILKKEGFSL